MSDDQPQSPPLFAGSPEVPVQQEAPAHIEPPTLPDQPEAPAAADEIQPPAPVVAAQVVALPDTVIDVRSVIPAGAGQGAVELPAYGHQNFVFGQTDGKGELSVLDILLDCKAPQFKTCQPVAGFFTACCGGCGLCWGTVCCCYGENRPDCLNVCVAGFLQGITSECIFGVVSGCCVGCRMLGVIQ